MTAINHLDMVTQPCSAQHHPCSKYSERYDMLIAKGRPDEAFLMGQRYRECIRGRPALPFDPSMIDDLMVISSGQPIWRILIWYEAGESSPTQFNTLLAQWWNIGGWAADIGKSRLTRMVEFAGFVADMEGVMAPIEPLTFYRGARWHHYRGLSWTTDERIAA